MGSKTLRFRQSDSDRAGDDERSPSNDARGDFFQVAKKQFAAEHDPERERRSKRRNHDYRPIGKRIEHEQEAQGFERAAAGEVADRLAVPDESVFGCRQGDEDGGADQADDADDGAEINRFVGKAQGVTAQGINDAA